MPDTTTQETVYSLFANRVAATPGEQALLIASANGNFRPRTWQELALDVQRWAVALRQAGARLGEPVVQWSANRYEWILADLALQAIQAIHVPLHATLTAAQAASQIVHCGARLVLVDRPQQVEALWRCPQRLPREMRLLCYGDGPTLQGTARHRMADLVQAVTPDALDRGNRMITEARDPQAIATILYTSGTTGQPKGIALTHGNLVSNTWAILQAFGEQPSDLRLCFLPLSHIFARTGDLYTWIARGSQLALTRSRETIMEDCKIVRPTLINGVPYFFERVHQQLVAGGLAAEPGSLRRVLGGEIRACCCGGAALNDDTFEFYHRQGVPLLPGYGLTEASPVITLSTLDQFKPGTVGRPIPGVEIRIADDGEILTRGPHVMHGYWTDAEATGSAIDEDGWLHTGDLGQLDDEQFLRITGRRKEMIVTATGKNVFPAHLESLLCRDPFIHQAMVIGDRQKYLVALIVPEAAALRAEIKCRRLWVWSQRSAVRHRRVRQLYRQRIDRQLQGLSPHEQVREFLLLDRGFTLESGQLTAKLSLCRPAIEQCYARSIANMYRTKNRPV